MVVWCNVATATAVTAAAAAGMVLVVLVVLPQFQRDEGGVGGGMILIRNPVSGKNPGFLFVCEKPPL